MWSSIQFIVCLPQWWDSIEMSRIPCIQHRICTVSLFYHRSDDRSHSASLFVDQPWLCLNVWLRSFYDLLNSLNRAPLMPLSNMPFFVMFREGDKYVYTCLWTQWRLRLVSDSKRQFSTIDTVQRQNRLWTIICDSSIFAFSCIWSVTRFLGWQ